MITVFTPTYNRAKLLPRLYESLCCQTFTDFEWLIVDDGSTDETEQTVQNFIDEDKIIIRYFKQPNGGKHRAINHGVREAGGELFFIVDSDDLLPTDSLTTIQHYWLQVKDNPNFGGVCGFDAYHDGRIIGSGLPSQTLDANNFEIRSTYHVSGDLKEVYRTSVLREFPFPEIQGERFCPEDLLWNRIAQRYKLRYFNHVIYTVEYLPDGLSAQIVKVRMDSPITATMTYQEWCGFNIPIKDKIKAAVNYWRFFPCIKDKNMAPRIAWQWHWARPLGWMMHRRDIKLRNSDMRPKAAKTK